MSTRDSTGGDDEEHDDELGLLNRSLDAASPDFDTQTGEDLVESLPDPEEVPREIKVAFWTVVMLVNGAMLTGSIGLLALALGWLQWAAILLGTTLILAALAYRRYWLFTREEDSLILR
ncbi:MAG: hypothetical protein ACLFR6_03360 [Salinarchaeum sp.]